METDWKKKHEDAMARMELCERTGLEKKPDYIFPELAESEDERHWKWILEYLYDGLRKSDEQFKDQFKLAIAYLEKQKAKERLDRMAPIYNDKESFESALEKAWKYYNESASRTVDSFEDDYIECVFSKGFREGFLYKEKQKEQKPAERSLEDDHIIGFVYDLLNEIEWKDSWAMSKDECLRLLSNYSPQKPAEWSEEDKKIMNEIITIMDGGKVTSGTYLSEYAAWLKSLKNRENFPKSNTNSPSWNEDDEKMLDLIIEIFTVNHANGVFGTGNRVINGFNFVSTYTIIGWLKSLRPQTHWKPSKEQMKALNEIINTLAVSKYPHESDYLFNMLNGLRKNLRKL